MCGEDAREEVEVSTFVFEYVVADLDFTVWVKCFFKWPHALCGESVVKKLWARSVRGVVGGHTI